jgi:hypothetical protein
MAVLNTQNVTTAGLAVTYQAGASGGDRFLPGERTFLILKNTSGGAIIATIATPGTLDGSLAIDNRTVSIPATTGERLVYVPDSLYRSADGLGDITYSVNPPTGLTVAVVAV